MLLRKLVFDNYKTYYGIQTIDFYIPKDVRQEQGKNIILLGGLNGAGKTTILKAILYVLFGKRGISSQEHKRLFSNVINNTFFDEGGRDCTVTLVIETDWQEEWELKVKWSFDNLKRLISENREVVVKKAGSRIGRSQRVDNLEAYNRIIDKMIPYNAAPFFIFDGEEIKEIILRQNSSDMKEAIHKITGMEAYKMLLKDLTSIKSNIEQELAKAVGQVKLKSYNTELQQTEEEIQKLEEKREQIESERCRLEGLITQVKQERSNKIARNSKSREVIVKKQTKSLTELQLAQKEFKAYFNDNATNILLGNKITQLKKRLKLENEIRHKKILQQASLAPYQNFIEQLLNRSINPPLSSSQLSQIKQLGEEIWVKENRIQQDIPENFVEFHDISGNDQSYLMNYALKDRNAVITKIAKIEQLQREVNELEIELRNAPASVDIEDENKSLDILTKKLGEQDLRLKSIISKLNKHKETKSNLLNNISRLSGQDVNLEALHDRLEYVNRLITAMNQYVDEMTAMKAQFIREEFANMLKKLFRKQDEFGKIEFDIETYTVRLYNDRGQEISIQDRSAGEMQMISSALIWALTKASDLSLPMVIDTPLGRLDSYHRNHLIHHYYKELSEQVIILSTDTEITHEYVDLMKKHSYRQYMLDYNEKKKYTIIRDGYFNFVKV